MPFLLKDASTAFIVGAGHGIGYSVLSELLEKNASIRIFATYNNVDRARDLLQLSQLNTRLELIQLNVQCEENISRVCEDLKSFLDGRNLDICLIASGILHNNDISPEKSITDIKQSQLLTYFEINSIVAPIVGKHIKSFFSKKKCSVFACLSAKVGSITDNESGGWYGYRASKAALNMYVKTISIEFKHSKLNTIALAIHPGTTATDLSKPFLKNIKHKVFSTEETAEHILKILDRVEISQSGEFISWDGAVIPW